MPTQTVISINRQTPIMGPATFYPRVVVERLRFFNYRMITAMATATTRITANIEPQPILVSFIVRSFTALPGI